MKAKSYYPNYYDLAYAWVERTCANESHTPKNRMFCIGDTLYSYGHHFPLCQRFVAKDTGETWYIISDAKYSQTTSTHRDVVHNRIKFAQLQGHDIHMAYLPRLKDYVVPSTKAELGVLVRDYAMDQLRDLAESYCKKRLPWDPHFSVSRIGDALKPFGLVLPDEASDLYSKMIAHYVDRLERNKLLEVKRRLAP